MAEAITAQDLTAYREAARRRREAMARRIAERRRRAWVVAREGAALLRERFGATRVLLFGSLLVPERFDMHSDVDLAVWGLADREYFRAVSHLLSLDPGISVDLVAGESAPASLLAAIEGGTES